VGPVAEACWVLCKVGIRMAASDLHKEVAAAAAAVEEADMMIGGDASGIEVGGSVAVGTWKTQEAPHSLVWL
jgi:hypothetical protein